MPSKSQNKHDYKCYYMDLANMLIYHGTEFIRASDPEAVRKINDQAIHEARKFIGRVEPSKSQPSNENIKQSA